MGTNCAPLVADLFLFCYERDFMLSLSDNDQSDIIEAFQGGTSFVDLLCFCSVLCLLCFVRVCLYVLCGHLLGKG